MTNATPQRPPRPFESVLLDAGWQPTKSVLFSFWIWEITETVWVSPYTARTHPLHKALKKEVKARQQSRHPLFV